MTKEIKFKINKNGCHICTSHCKDEEGYVVCKRNGKSRPIYRHIYRLYKGIPKKGMVIRHTCDNRKCINPHHLIIGTHKDNVMDRVKRGRSAVGNKNGRAKLTARQALSVYRDKKSTRTELAKKYGVDSQVIRKIQIGETWRNTLKKYPSRVVAKGL